MFRSSDCQDVDLTYALFKLSDCKLPREEALSNSSSRVSVSHNALPRAGA